MEACATCPVRESAICHTLPADQLEELGRLGRQHAVRKGQTLQWEGEESLLVGNVIDGVVKLSASTWRGRDQTLGIAYPGDFIGRPFGAKSQESVTALTDAHVCTFTRGSFDEFARRHPDLEHGLLQRTLLDLEQARSWILLLGAKTASERVAAFVLETACRLVEHVPDDADEPISFTLPFTRQEIADVLGLTIETVSRQITELRCKRVIDTSKGRLITILDRAALETCAASQ